MRPRNCMFKLWVQNVEVNEPKYKSRVGVEGQINWEQFVGRSEIS